MTFKEWLNSLEPERKQSTGEDIADSIGLFVLIGLVLMTVFL
jgi:hypothetical protein